MGGSYLPGHSLPASSFASSSPRRLSQEGEVLVPVPHDHTSKRRTAGAPQSVGDWLGTRDAAGRFPECCSTP